MPHIHEKIDFTVEVFVVFENKVLLRLHDKYGIWLSVGGHIELDEDPNQAALREVKEETGLDVELFDTREFKGDRGVKELIAPVSMNRHRINDNHEHVSMIYFAKADSDQVFPENPGDQLRWCSLDDLKSLPDLQENIVFYGSQAIKKLFD